MFYHWSAGRRNGASNGGSGGGNHNLTSVSNSVNMDSSTCSAANGGANAAAASANNRHLRTHLFFGGGNGGPNDQPPSVANNRRNSQLYNLNDFDSYGNSENQSPGPNDGSPSKGGRFHNSPNRCKNANGKDQRNNNFDGGRIVQNNINNASMVNHNNNNNNVNIRAPFIQISCPTPIEGLPPTPFGSNTPGAQQRSRSSTRNSIKTPSPARSASSTGAPVTGRQMTRMGRSASNAGSTASSSSDTVVTVSLAGAIQQLHEDCFIIPAHRMNNFLPMSLSDSEKQQVGSLNMMHVDDPKLCIILHFAEPSSPSLNLQLTALRASLSRLQATSTASEGMILMNIERRASYPFIVYLVVNSAQTTPCAFLHTYNSIIVEELSPDKLGVEDSMEFPGINYISGYEEVATIARPPIDIHPKVPSNQKSGFLITIFKVFPGDDREKLERSWLLWTGARVIYKSLPNCLGLRRITFHKKLWPDGGITYVLMCECTEMMDYVTIACGFVEHLRARCCGYTGIYKNVEKF